ncbi:conserved membrane hypothetical protein [Gammaproteobacteria bacterium]
MSIIEQFSWRRLGLFMKSDLVMNSSKIFTFALTIFVVLFLYGLISLDGLRADNFHTDAFALLLFFGGLWLTSRTFADLHNKERSQSFLLLPVSNLEKLLGRLLLTTIGYIVGVVLIFYIVSLLVAGFAWLALSETAVIFQPIHKNIIHYFVNYILLQSIFFLGSIYFKSNNFNKTILCLCGLTLGVFLVKGVIFSVFLGANFLNGWQVLMLYGTKIQLIFTIMVPPCAWLVAYLRLCESEV